MNDIKKLTWLAYLTFLFVGMLFISQGILIIYLAKDYSLPLAKIGYLFFIPAVLQAAMTYVSGFLIEKLSLKKMLFVSYILILLSFTGMFSGYLPIFILGLICMGTGYGIMLTIPNFTLITLYPNDKFSKLNMLNFFFSLGGISGPFIIGTLLDFNIPWKNAFLLVFIIGISLIYLLYRSNFAPLINARQENDKEKVTKKEKWHLSVYLIGLALILYILSEVVFSAWIVAYFKHEYNFSIFNATLALTVYWFFITFGRFAADKVGKHMKIYNFILMSTILAMVPFIFIFFIKAPFINFFIIGIMGLGFASLYASMFSYGMDQFSVACTKAMSFFVLCGTIGNILAMPISSYFVERYGITYALVISLLMIIAVFILISLTLFDKQNRAINTHKHRLWGAISKVTRIIEPSRILSMLLPRK